MVTHKFPLERVLSLSNADRSWALLVRRESHDEVNVYTANESLGIPLASRHDWSGVRYTIWVGAREYWVMVYPG